MGKSHENAFIMTVQRDFQCLSLKSLLQHTFYFQGQNDFKPVMPKLHENQILTLITQQRCKSLCNHGLFKYSMFLAALTLLVILPFLRGDP